MERSEFKDFESKNEWYMRILIAENKLTLARGLKFLLEKNKYTVDLVANGADALTFFGDWRTMRVEGAALSDYILKRERNLSSWISFSFLCI